MARVERGWGVDYETGAEKDPEAVSKQWEITGAAWKVDELAASGFHAIAPNHYHALPEGVGFLQRRNF